MLGLISAIVCGTTIGSAVYGAIGCKEILKRDEKLGILELYKNAGCDVGELEIPKFMRNKFGVFAIWPIVVNKIDHEFEAVKEKGRKVRRIKV